MTNHKTSTAAVPVDVRLELLVDHLADQITPAREMVAALRLQSNASTTTRSTLEHLSDVTGAIWETLNVIRDEAAAIRSALDNN